MLQQRTILVIGDVMLDKYFIGDVKRISPEAPVPIFKKIIERCVLGGAANVAANLVAAKQKVSILTIVGNDSNGELLLNLLAKKCINTSLVLKVDRVTTEKTRFLADNNQQVLRLDVEDSSNISDKICNQLLKSLKMHIVDFDIILLSDYLKGLLTETFTQGVLEMAAAHNIPVIIDVKDSHISKYSGAYLLKPNLNEIRVLTNMPAQIDEEIVEAAQYLRKGANCKYVLTTCGARGMVLVGENDEYFVDAIEKEVYDVSGAGDTTIAYLAVCMANGLSMHKCVDVANIAASIQVSKLGTSSVYFEEVIKELQSKRSIPNKMINCEDLQDFRKTHGNKKIVFTNGCFDILHVGHKRYLQKAAELGDLLVIGVNSDASVKRLKGSERPVNNEMDRAELLCALGFVDYIVIFEEDTPYEIIKALQPDVLVKGGDYKYDKVIGKDIVEGRGGELVLIPFIDGKSTTNIINKIKK